MCAIEVEHVVLGDRGCREAQLGVPSTMSGLLGWWQSPGYSQHSIFRNRKDVLSCPNMTRTSSSGLETCMRESCLLCCRQHAYVSSLLGWTTVDQHVGGEMKSCSWQSSWISLMHRRRAGGGDQPRRRLCGGGASRMAECCPHERFAFS